MAGKKVDFETAMGRLQEIVQKLESGEESLENSMKLFEEGAKLSAKCYEILEKAEQRVAQLKTLDQDQTSLEEPEDGDVDDEEL
ncbi:MAG: exodeoxyribonuclease VII small subunit [Acutalibacter sp.]|jgi:exodeoxyribonuclease VII small subunit